MSPVCRNSILDFPVFSVQRHHFHPPTPGLFARWCPPAFTCLYYKEAFSDLQGSESISKGSGSLQASGVRNSLSSFQVLFQSVCSRPCLKTSKSQLCRRISFSLFQSLVENFFSVVKIHALEACEC